MRADLPLLGPDELDEAVWVEQGNRARAVDCTSSSQRSSRRSRSAEVRRVIARSSCIDRTACASRRDTMSGRAPPSLIENSKPAGRARSNEIRDDRAPDFAKSCDRGRDVDHALVVGQSAFRPALRDCRRRPRRRRAWSLAPGRARSARLYDENSVSPRFVSYQFRNFDGGA